MLYWSRGCHRHHSWAVSLLLLVSITQLSYAGPADLPLNHHASESIQIENGTKDYSEPNNGSASEKAENITDEPKSIPNTSKIAIIIDDIGYSKQHGQDAITLPGAMTYAIIPHSPNATFFALEAQKRNKEVMLHAPMSNVHNIPLGKDGLTDTMSEVRFKQALNSALDSLPNISGVNNHMGSLLTQKALPMEWLMQSLGKRQLYFIDSRTTSQSVAWKIAQSSNIPSLKRDIFLDHEATPEFIDQQFKKLVSLAKKRGYAVAIAHPYPTTIRYLKQSLPQLSKEGIELVTISELVKTYSPNLLAQKNTKLVTELTKR